MIPTDLSPLWNHLWQSTFCASAVWLLALAVRKNRAAVRYWLWFAAFVGFNLFQSSFTNFCPLEMILKKLGVGRDAGSCCAPEPAPTAPGK